jgi:hypothetical protein
MIIKKLISILSICGITIGLSGLPCITTNASTTKNNQDFVIYKQALQTNKDHKFTTNQIRSFVYYWYGLHDVHADINKSYAVLDQDHLLMVFPDGIIHNLTDYKKWYDAVGANIKNNLHIVKNLEITPISNHQYQVNVVVNWQAIDKNDKFIDTLVTQRWLLVDGPSDTYPYIREYKIINFKS